MYVRFFSKQIQNSSQPQTPEVKTEPDVKISQAEALENALAGGHGSQKDEKNRMAFYSSVTDYRSLVKTLVCGVKTITWGCAACKVSFFFFFIYISIYLSIYLLRDVSS